MGRARPGARRRGGSVVVQVQLRRDDTLYVNDGIYGSLSDAGVLGFRFPARRIRLGAYDACLRTQFNGFGRADLVEVADPPMLATPGYE